MTEKRYDCERALEKGTGEDRLFHLSGMEFHVLVREKAPPLHAPGSSHVAAVRAEHAGADFDALLDGASGVSTLLIDGASLFGDAKTRFALHRPHANVELVVSAAPLSAETLAALPNLRGADLRPITPIEVAALPSTLERIKTKTLDFGALARFPRLRHIQTLPEGQDARHLAALPELRGLEFVGGKCRNEKALGRITSLERLRAQPFGLPDLKPLAACVHIEELDLWPSGELDGIEAFTSLKRLHLGGRRTPRLEPLRRVPSLEELEIDSGRLPVDFEVIGELASLRRVRLWCGSISVTTSIPSARLFEKLTRLEHLDCFHTVVEDPDLSPLGGLSKLRYVNFQGLYPQTSVEYLRRKLPECRLDHVYVGERKPERPKQKIGPVHVSFKDGRWEIFEELAERLDLETNHEVQDAVAAELRKSAPAVLERLELDSERDVFCAVARSRADIERVAAAIATVARLNKKR